MDNWGYHVTCRVIALRLLILQSIMQNWSWFIEIKIFLFRLIEWCDWQAVWFRVKWDKLFASYIDTRLNFNIPELSSWIQAKC